MSSRRILLSIVAVLYFATVIGLTFTTGPVPVRQFWFWPLVAFVPVGVLLVLLVGVRRWWAALGFAMLGAAWIEVAQSIWMPAGYSELVDLGWAMVGSSIGVFLGTRVTHSLVSSTPAPVRASAEPVASHEPPRLMNQPRARDLP